jgi:replication initiation and membrane attachment protein
MNTINIYAPIDLSGHDHKVISLLYRPLIGSVAFSLYHFIFSFTYQREMVEIQEEMILNVLVITKKEFEDACNLLHVHALLDVYEKPSHILLQLKKPMTAKQFLTDTIFGITLEQKIGSPTLTLMIDQFKVLEPSIGYARKEVHFDDIFDIDHVKRLAIHGPLFENGGVHHPQRKSSFPYEGWVDQLVSTHKKPVLLKPSTRQLIENLVYIYQFKYEDLNTIITSLKPDQLIKKEAIQLAAKRYFEKHQILTIEEKKDTGFIDFSRISPMHIIHN